MKSKITVGIIICLIVSMMIGPGFAQYDSYKPILGVVQPEDVQTIEVGKDNTFTVTIKNKSSMAARMIRVTLKGDHPFRSDINDLTETVTYLNPNTSADVTFDVDLSPTVSSRIYEFDIVLEYYNYYDSTYSEVEKGYVKVINNNVEPILGLVASPNSDPEITKDKPAAVVFKLKNTGTIDAKDLRVTASGFSNQGVVLYNDVETKAVQAIAAGDTNMIYFNVVSGKDMEAGTYPIKIDVTYKDDFGGSYAQEFTSYLTLEGSSVDEPELSIENIKIPEKLQAGSDFKVSFDIVNIGNSVIERAEVDFTYPTEFISKSNSRIVVKNLEPGARKSYSYTLMPKAETLTESYHSYIQAKFYSEGQTVDQATSIQEYVGLYVESSDQAGSKPKLIVDNYNYGGEYVYAGSDYTLDLFIKNTSNSTGTRNIKVTLTSEDNVFTPIDASSSFFISNIGPGEVYHETISLKTKIDASVKIYALSVKMEYEDSEGNAYDQNNNPYEETESLSIAVAQPVRLETSDLVLPFEIYAGQPFYLEQEFYNMGKSTMYNMMVKLDGVQTSEGSYFVGNFEAGRSDYFSAQIFAGEPGEFSGTLIYTFEDALGNISTTEEPFNYFVMEAPNFSEEYPEFPMEPEMPVEEPSEGFGKYLIGGGILLAVVAFFVFRSRRKKRLAKELEALDE